ncbi:hypothetical protein A2U01_0073417, partial [Trifolium medium]|nr:hypothetical protein [Trifolium medium]
MDGATRHRPLRDAQVPNKKNAACHLNGATRQYPYEARRSQKARLSAEIFTPTLLSSTSSCFAPAYT